MLNKERIGELAEVRRLIDTPVNYPLMHLETWQLAIDAILQGRAGFERVAAYLCFVVKKRNNLKDLYRDVMQQASPARKTEIEAAYQGFLIRLEHYDRR